MLVVGAGNGNDVAVALMEGARHVDAVEIDPVIQAIGAADHPDHPYQDPRVTVHIDDGRAFLERSRQRYDLIVFALPDSLTLVSGQSSLRLESYLFTVQAMQSVRSHLRPDGAFTMYNYYLPGVFDRYAETITRAFGHPPSVDLGPPSAGPRRQGVLTVGRTAGAITHPTPWVAPRHAPPSATDDWPFPYLPSRSIPPFYLVTLLLILVGSAALARRFGGPFREMRPYLDLFFMGAAFLLLETKNVVQFALLFGTTWFVNALVFFGILLAVLLAVEAARRLTLPPAKLLYLLLTVSLARRLAGASRAPAGAVVPAAPGRRHRPRLCAGVPRQPGVRPALPRRRVVHRGFRRQPARGDGGRCARVHRAHHRLPRAPGPGLRPVPAGLPDKAAAPPRSLLLLRARHTPPGRPGNSR